MSRIELVNADVLAAQLLALPNKIRVAVEKKAIKESNKLILDSLRQNAPVETGALRKSLSHDIRQHKGGNVIIGRVGADSNYVGTVERNKKGKKTFKRSKNAVDSNVRRPAKYLHLVNLGTKDRKTKAGHDRGSVTGAGFREKTIAQLAPQIQQILEHAVIEALNQ